jgi:hypothetical protein
VPFSHAMGVRLTPSHHNNQLIVRWVRALFSFVRGVFVYCLTDPNMTDVGLLLHGAVWQPEARQGGKVPTVQRRPHATK